MGKVLQPDKYDVGHGTRRPGSCGSSPGLHRSVTVLHLQSLGKAPQNQHINISNPYEPCDYIVELETCLACERAVVPNNAYSFVRTEVKWE